jgi:peptidyl-prolyl cis-trans isomerase C
MMKPSKSLLLMMISVWNSEGFAPTVRSALVEQSTSLHGIFDGLKKAFENQEYSAPPEGIKASARHILVRSKDEANEVLDKLSNGASFATVASQFSSCPSSARGGSLGSFGPGTMVSEFDSVVFDPKTKLGEVVGPVETKFGYHLIVVDNRTGV